MTQSELRERVRKHFNLYSGQPIPFQDGYPADKAVDDLVSFIEPEVQAAVLEVLDRIDNARSGSYDEAMLYTMCEEIDLIREELTTTERREDG